MANNKRRNWIISLGFSEADADNFIQFEVPDWKIEKMASQRQKPEPLPEATESTTVVTNDLVCSVCGKECKSAFGLKSHMRTHK